MIKELKECIAAVKQVISEQGVAVYFQPVISLESRGIVGFEAFARGVDELGNTVADASCLFNESLPPQARRRVEQLCLSKSLQSYRSISEKYPTMLLLLNVNLALFSDDLYEGMDFESLFTPFEYNPRQVVLEFDSEQLQKKVPMELIRKLQKQGYRISVDNVDAGLACKERMLRIRPDFAKLDRSLYAGIENSGYIKRMAASAAMVIEQVGAIPVAKGVESEAESFALAETGFCLQQGYFFSDKAEEGGNFADKVARVHFHYRENRLASVNDAQKTFREMHLILKSAISRLQSEDPSMMNGVLDDLVKRSPELVSAFILSDSGKQVSKTVVGKSGDRVGVRIKPAAVGSDHSCEEYFMYLNAGLEKCAGYLGATPFCRQDARYLAGYFYRDNARKGLILVLQYVDKLLGENS
ncbi:EAL domain-containing protein [Maridesulfovibrio sp. FT414]|uniref:EAL domain-containing protein n=1 Tax=Maridesulfovibrio sp. FT414 TaxID=2979469 RepID=UPI003D807889